MVLCWYLAWVVPEFPLNWESDLEVRLSEVLFGRPFHRWCSSSTSSDEPQKRLRPSPVGASRSGVPRQRLASGVIAVAVCLDAAAFWFSSTVVCWRSTHCRGSWVQRSLPWPAVCCLGGSSCLDPGALQKGGRVVVPWAAMEFLCLCPISLILILSFCHWESLSFTVAPVTRPQESLIASLLSWQGVPGVRLQLSSINEMIKQHSWKP